MQFKNLPLMKYRTTIQPNYPADREEVIRAVIETVFYDNSVPYRDLRVEREHGSRWLVTAEIPHALFPTRVILDRMIIDGFRQRQYLLEAVDYIPQYAM